MHRHCQKEQPLQMPCKKLRINQWLFPMLHLIILCLLLWLSGSLPFPGLKKIISSDADVLIGTETTNRYSYKVAKLWQESLVIRLSCKAAISPSLPESTNMFRWYNQQFMYNIRTWMCNLSPHRWCKACQRRPGQSATVRKESDSKLLRGGGFHTKHLQFKQPTG